MANEFIARKGLIVLANGAKVTGSLGVQGDINATGYNVTASNLQLLGSASINGDITIGGNLTVGNADLDVVKFLAEVSSSIVPDVNNAFDLGSGSKYWKDLYVSGTAYIGTVQATTINLDSITVLEDLTVQGNTNLGNALTDNVIISGSVINTGSISSTSISGSFSGSGAQITNIPNSGLVNSSVTVTAGSGLTQGGSVSLGGSVTVALDTGSATFNDGVKTKLNTEGIFSSSVQTDVRNTTGIATIATTGSNVFTAGQTISGSVLLGSNGEIRVVNNTASTLFGFYDGTNILGSYYQMFGNNYSNTTQRGSAEFVFDTQNGGVSGFNVAEYNGSTWTRRFRVDSTGANVTGSFAVTEGITGSLLSTNGVVSSSNQIDVRNTTGIATIATTGSNTFTGIQTISNTTNSTNFADGALIVQGGVGITKDVNISGSLTVTGLLTAVSTSIQYVTSSQLNIGLSRITVNDDDLVRFAGLSVVDSGSTFGTGSFLWDSLSNRWIVEADDANYESAVLIVGPKHTGTLGDEPSIVDYRVPVGFTDHHIDNRVESSSIRVDFPSRLTHVEAGLVITGSVTSSVGFSGDGSQLTGIVTELALTGSDGGTGTVSLKTQALTVDGTNGLTATVSGQTITISGSNATDLIKGVASYNVTNFTVTGGNVASNAINFNGANINLGGTHSFGLQNITPYGASTADQVTFNGGAIVHGVLFTSGSNTDVDSGTEVIATVTTGSYDAAYFDYVVKKGSNYRAGTVTAVWEAGTSNVEFTDVSTNDLGSTADVVLSVDILSATARLKATVSSDNWIVKTAVRAL
jgi:hypothetical protein